MYRHEKTEEIPIVKNHENCEIRLEYSFTEHFNNDIETNVNTVFGKYC